jgi:DNA-binding response OmpR family regulator
MSKSILHIDDEAPLREIITELLEAQGYRVRSVATPSAAIAAAREEKPDLIITDLQLDEADGLVTIAELRKLDASTPVILLTGVLIDPKVARETVGRLVTSYLEKTRPLAEILKEVTRLIGPAQ